MSEGTPQEGGEAAKGADEQREGEVKTAAVYDTTDNATDSTNAILGAGTGVAVRSGTSATAQLLCMGALDSRARFVRVDACVACALRGVADRAVFVALATE